MSKSRLTSAAFAVAAAVLLQAPSVHAADDVAATVSEVAADAADLVAQEFALLAETGPGADHSPSDLARLQAELRSVDAQGASALDQLRRLDVELTDAIQVALDRLPPAGSTLGAELGLQPPPPIVYEAARADLLRVSATPEAVLPGPTSDRGPAVGLLIVAALALLALGAFALGSTIRRRPASEELAAMAWSDGLTGLANRRRLDHDLASSHRHQGATAVIMVDVDHFKSVNDNFGHQKGDEILRTISTMLASQIRYDDVVYRYGGEEFCILLPNSSTEDARKVADRIVDAAHRISLPDGRHVTVSVGISASVLGDINTAVESADQALYEAKDLGRDRAVTANLIEHTIA